MPNLIGQSIPGSRLVWDHCDACGELIRVVTVRHANRCADCTGETRNLMHSSEHHRPEGQRHGLGRVRQ